MRIESLITLTGWRRRGLAALLGVCAAGALPPVYALPLLIPAFAGLFLLVRAAGSARLAFRDGWWWGLGYFTAGLYWICISLWVEPEKFAWLTPVALFGLPSILALYTGLVTLLLRALGRKAGDRVALLLFAGLWVGAEYLRAHLFTGFPWNLIGYVWTVTDVTLQTASVTGIYGLGWMTVMLAAMPALFFSENSTARGPHVFAALLLAAMVALGVWRLDAHPTQYTTIQARIVQANVRQSLKWDSNLAMDGLRKHVRLSHSAGGESAKLILWPETAVPFFIQPQSQLARDLGGFMPKDALLLTGGLRSAGQGSQDAFNSVFALDNEGRIVAQYDKHHLVPFGEYIPLRSLPPVRWLISIIANEMGDFGRGPGPSTLAIEPYPPFSPLVCYEAIFPGEATDGTRRAQWLFSLTDDAWFGYSSGLPQDAQMARMRAVEQGLPLLRAANTGVSAAFDAYGRTIARLPLETEGVLDLYLPKAAGDEPIVSRYPMVPLLFIIAGSMTFLCFRPKKAQDIL